MNPIYLDYNATTPIDPEVATAMRPFLDQYFGNPSSNHRFGIEAKQAVEAARRQVADLIGAQPDEIVFTSGGSESDNMALKGIAFANADSKRHIITSAIEHPAIIEVCHWLGKQGFRITYLPVDEYGIVEPASLRRAIAPDTVLVSVMHANNETGSIQPIRELGDIAHEQGILVHTDAAQSMGKIPVLVDELGVDLLTIAGHKLYAPKGIGVLYIRRGTRIEKLIHGASHERNLRAGTENILEIVGLGKACEISKRDQAAIMQHLRETRDRLQRGLDNAGIDYHLNGHPTLRLPNTLSVGFRGCEANTILSELTGVAASAGAACHSDRIDVSPVLTAMNVTMEYAMGTIRFSTGRMTTIEDCDRAIADVVRVVRGLQQQTPQEVHASPGDTALTRYTHGLGCACKIQPQVLEQVLANIPGFPCEAVMVGTETSDDAAVYRINNQQAIVVTTDFFTPIVDDPGTFGAIAAANALSDLYAMGATPLFALNLVAFPINRLPIEVLQSILRGAADKTTEAGIPIIGGHSIEDPEPKFGLVAVGIVDPDKIWKNRGIRPGDAILLSKPLGTGILSTAMKRGLLPADQQQVLMDCMAKLNRSAAEIITPLDVHACTDVTGFGLLGHLGEMVRHSEIDVRINSTAVPILPGVTDMITLDAVPGGTKANLTHAGAFTDWNPAIPESTRLILSDAQTSGGLLIAVGEEALPRLKERDTQGIFVRIGTADGKGSGRIIVG